MDKKQLIHRQIVDSLACPQCQGALVWQDDSCNNFYCRYCKVLYELQYRRDEKNGEYLVANFLSPLPEAIKKSK